ncbi:MAG: DUF1080 domain-containing protein [Pirellulaceae bacterium]
MNRLRPVSGMVNVALITAGTLFVSQSCLTNAAGGRQPRGHLAAAHTIMAPDIDGEGWRTLINGDSLDGWVARNGTATYKVENNQIVGRSFVGSASSLLCTSREYADFELTFEILLDQDLNSGIQVRSFSNKELNNGRVCGPQIEIEASTSRTGGVCETGYIFSEGTGRGWLSQNRIVNDAFVDGQWNRIVIRVVGSRIQTWVNGRKIEDLLDDSSPRSGFIGLQVHSVPTGTQTLEVRWRDLRIRELPANG